MKRKGYIDGLADDLLKKKEASDKLLSLAGRASGLTAFLVKKSKEDVMRAEAMKRIPELKEKLEEKKEFFDRKSVKSDHIRILTKEIIKCEAFINGNLEEYTADDFRLILEWYFKTKDKYGF